MCFKGRADWYAGRHPLGDLLGEDAHRVVAELVEAKPHHVIRLELLRLEFLVLRGVEARADHLRCHLAWRRWRSQRR